MKKVEMFANEFNQLLRQTVGVENFGFVDNIVEYSATNYKGKKYVNKFTGTGIGFSNDNNLFPYVLIFTILDDNKVNLQYLETTQPGKGIGTIIMKSIIQTAKKIDIKLQLEAIPVNDGKFANPNMNRQQQLAWDAATDKLINFYKKFGFDSWNTKQPFRMKYLAA